MSKTPYKSASQVASISSHRNLRNSVRSSSSNLQYPLAAGASVSDEEIIHVNYNSNNVLSAGDVLTAETIKVEKKTPSPSFSKPVNSRPGRPATVSASGTTSVTPKTTPRIDNVVSPPKDVPRKRLMPKLQSSKTFLDPEMKQEASRRIPETILKPTLLHFGTTGEYMKQLYLEETLTDVTLNIGANYVNVHRVVLASHSEFFRDRFTKPVDAIENQNALGGQNENQDLLSSVERYDPIERCWRRLPSMSTCKLGCSVAAHRSLLWVVGGYDDVNNGPSPVIKTVEVFDPARNAWKKKRSLRFARCMSSLVECAGRLYLLGGATKCQSSKEPLVVSIAAVDVYDDMKDEWTEVGQLEEPRYNAGCSVVGQKIYVAGGLNSIENKSISSVECYNAKQGVWVKGIRDLPKLSLGLCCVTVPPLADL